MQRFHYKLATLAAGKRDRRSTAKEQEALHHTENLASDLTNAIRLLHPTESGRSHDLREPEKRGCTISSVSKGLLSISHFRNATCRFGWNTNMPRLFLKGIFCNVSATAWPVSFLSRTATLSKRMASTGRVTTAQVKVLGVRICPSLLLSPQNRSQPADSGEEQRSHQNWFQ